MRVLPRKAKALIESATDYFLKVQGKNDFFSSQVPYYLLDKDKYFGILFTNLAKDTEKLPRIATFLNQTRGDDSPTYCVCCGCKCWENK